jgi:hypothetical protein
MTSRSTVDALEDYITMAPAAELWGRIASCWPVSNRPLHAEQSRPGSADEIDVQLAWFKAGDGFGRGPEGPPTIYAVVR